jgi:hypothetical protein
VSISAPAVSQHYSYLQGAVTLRGVASATRGIASVQVKLDNGTYVPTTLSGSTWTKSITVSHLTVGGHRLYVQATAKTTGAVTTISRVFVRDNIPAGSIGPSRTSYTSRLVSKTAGFTTVGYGPSPDRKALDTTGTSVARFTVYGQILDLHFERRPDAGEVRITVDGKASILNLYGAKSADVFRRYAGLSAGKHSVVIQALHTKVRQSRGFVALLGFLQVYA